MNNSAMNKFWLIILIFCFNSVSATSIIKSGKANAVIIIASKSPKYVVAAAKDFQYHIKKSSGIELPIENDLKTDKLSSTITKIFIGAGLGTTKFDKQVSKLLFEEFWIKSEENSLFFLANDNAECPAIHYAICEWLEKSIGAKWLWPGDLGTIVEKKNNIQIGSWDYKWRSPYDVREMAVVGSRYDPEIQLWLTHHRLRSRYKFVENQEFERWHIKYKKSHPEILVNPPVGVNHVVSPEQEKFNFKEPKLYDLIYEDWVNKGKPQRYNLTITDGYGYNPNLLPSEDPKDVYNGKLELTKPYLEFYSKVESFFAQKQGVPRFDVLAYSKYAEYPAGYRWNGKNFNVFLVDKTLDRKNWDNWKSSGASMYLRPNWWWAMPLSPYIKADVQGDFFNYCKKNGLKGFFFDAILNQWAAQGLNYYTLARLSYRDKSPEDILKEYTSSFGNGEKIVKNYIKSAELYSKYIDSSQLKSVRTLLNKGSLNYSSLAVTPHLFDNNKIQCLQCILQKNKKSKLDSEDSQRLEWLLSGLQLATVVNDFVKETWRKTDNKEASENLYREALKISKKYPYAITEQSFKNIVERKYTYYNSPKD